MIELSVDPTGEVIAKQYLASPAIYLDLWAIKDFSLDLRIAERFVKALVRKSGTLVLSWIHFLELSQLRNEKQVSAIIEFFEKASPHVFFMDVIPKSVIDKEDSLLKGKVRIAPHADDRFLKLFLTHRRQGPNPLTVGEFLKDFQQERVVSMCQSFLNELIETVEKSRRRAQANPKLAAHIKQIPSGPDLPHATRFINIDALQYVVRDKIKVTPRDWRDLFHMIVPLAYCDILLLDHRWTVKAREIVERLQRVGNKAQMAEVFSGRELEQFWKIFDTEETRIAKPEAISLISRVHYPLYAIR